MKILTTAGMRELDRRAIEGGMPGIVLMENAGLRVVEFLQARYSPLSKQRIVVFCGKGNNGGDGFVVARHLLLRCHPAALHVIAAESPQAMQGDAAIAYKMFASCGGEALSDLTPVMSAATLVIDALLGTGVEGDLRPPYSNLAVAINERFPVAKIVAVDVPSGSVRADHTISFVAPKIEQLVGNGHERNGELIVANIGTPPTLLDAAPLSLSQPEDFVSLFQPRPRDANKGLYGHVLVIGGSPGKTGAASMAGQAALRAGAGLVSVASHAASLPFELMGEPVADIDAALARKTLLAIGPGLDVTHENRGLVERLVSHSELPIVVDAGGLNCLAGTSFQGQGRFRVLTPHPGEMARLAGITTAEVQRDRLGVALRFAGERNVIVVLKGDRTVIAHPDGRAWINPTGTPALATGGTGDILTGLVAGLAAQFTEQRELAVHAAVWLHGRAGELGAMALGEKSLIATDVLRYLPQAIEECLPVA